MKHRNVITVLVSIVIITAVSVSMMMFWFHQENTLASTHGAVEQSPSPESELKIELEPEPEPIPEINKEEYDAILRRLAHLDEDATVTGDLWPVEAAYPNYGAILPFHRIVAYYGNFYSTRMGVLGEYSRETVIEKLKAEMKKWGEADPTLPIMPAIEYIAVVAQAGAGADGGYRARMPDKEIDKALSMAEELDGIVILDVQPGRASLQKEIESLEKYLAMPQVHLAIDPEFVMEDTSSRPGLIVGHVDADDVNTAAEYLASLVQEYNLPPKILVVHRYTQSMVRNYDQITPLPEVQIVMDMDGWGYPGSKFNTYNSFIYPEPVQFTGFKLFYKNDTRLYGSWLLTPDEILSLTPQPIFIQYQ